MNQRTVAPGKAALSCGEQDTSPAEAVQTVGEWLRNHVGIPLQHVQVDVGHEWCLRRADGSVEPLLVRLTRETLALPAEAIVALLQPLVLDAKTGPPEPPGHYLLSPEGLTVRGMIRFGWDLYGQDVRCFLCSRFALAEGGLGECREWRVSVDHVDRGAIEGAGLEDDRDTIERLATEHLRRTNGIRVPPRPWAWSVLDADGREWWGRLDVEPAGTEVRLIQASARREKRLPWEPGLRPPTPAELRALISRIRHT